MVNYKNILGQLGEDPDREGLDKTPERVAKAMQFLTQGYELDANAILDSAKFHEPMSEMIIVKDMNYIVCASIICFPFLAKRMLLISPTDGSQG